MNHNLFIYAAGTVLARPKGPFLHWGVVTECGTVFHNTPERGEHESSVEEFAANNPVSVQYYIGDTNTLRARLHGRRTNPRNYDAAFWNCEDTVADLAGSWPRMTQVTMVVVGLAAIVAFIVALRRQ